MAALNLPRLTLWLLLGAFVSGCSTTGTSPGGTSVVTPQPDYEQGAPQPTPPAVKPPPEPQQPAVGSSPYADLLHRAAAARAEGDYEQALALLERAQRIDPDSAEIYLNLAATHSARGDSAQARATAERGLLYCHGGEQCQALREYTR